MSEYVNDLVDQMINDHKVLEEDRELVSLLIEEELFEEELYDLNDLDREEDFNEIFKS